MKIVDAHCHVSMHWYEPVESLLFQMDRAGVEQAVLVQFMGQFDNAYQAACVARHPDRFATVVLVDTSSPQVTEQLERHAERGAKGVRLRPDSRSPGVDPLAIWRKAEALGLVVSCSGTKESFSSETFVQVVQAVPNLTIVLEHLGSFNHPDDEPAPFPVRKQVFALARFPNIYCKIHGLGEFCHRKTVMNSQFPFHRERLAILEMAYQAFGPDRLMWGSDFPPVSGREGYLNALQLTRDQICQKGAEAVNMIFGEVARKVFGL